MCMLCFFSAVVVGSQCCCVRCHSRPHARGTATDHTRCLPGSTVVDGMSGEDARSLQHHTETTTTTCSSTAAGQQAIQSMRDLWRSLLLSHNNGLVQDCSISSALALEMLQSCTKPLIYWQYKCKTVVSPVHQQCRLHSLALTHQNISITTPKFQLSLANCLH